MLEVSGLSSGYGRLPVLFDLSFTVNDGEVVALLGPNGAGKSTLLKTIFGLVRVRSGEIAWADQRITNLPAAERFAGGVSLCPEARRIFANLSVKENLLTGAFSKDKAFVQRQLDFCCELFPKLRQRIGQRGGSLSGGEQQMLAIARSLMSGPSLVLIDELSMGLAPIIVQQLTEQLRALADEGLSMIIVDQFASTLSGCADRALVLDKGAFSYEGPLRGAASVLQEAIAG